ncbi:MAG: hypothetical protein Q8R28_01555 [Dehalococcoidia bacterium]|nr:hypothetical protein [Dehalococcoidia bacterium]
MPFTANSDLYGAIHEEGINRVAAHIMKQRPSLFNYGTALVAANPRLLCEPINAAPAVTMRGNPLITIENPLPVLGTDGAFGVNFCVQLTKAEIDFHPGNVLVLPPELSPPLAPQHLAFRVRVCGGLGCPPKGYLDTIQLPPPPTGKPNQDRPEPKLPPTALPTEKLECFCIDLFVVAHVEVTGLSGHQILLTKVDGLEIVDIEPKGLENSLECYLNLLIRLVVLPRTSFAIEKLVFDILKLGTVTLKASPTSASIPHNPAIENDELRVFIDLEVSP